MLAQPGERADSRIAITLSSFWRTGINEGTLYRIETARSRPQKRTLIALLDLYEVTGALRTDLAESRTTGKYMG